MSQSPVPLLKTCQTCFQAKIRCVKTQESELCDRCLRLGKTCIFNPARRRQKDKLDVKTRRMSRSPSNKPSQSREALSGTTSDSPVGEDGSATTFHPFTSGILTAHAGQVLIDHFKTKMIPYFPFVLFTEDVHVSELMVIRPCACLAALAAASHSNVETQTALGGLFNRMVMAKMSDRQNFSTIDLLQGLLIHIAWYVVFLPGKSMHVSCNLTYLADA